MLTSTSRETIEYQPIFNNDYPLDDRHKTTQTQKLFKVAYLYAIDGVFLTVVLTSEFIPNVIPQPYKEVMKSGLVLTGIEVADVIHALTERKHPFYNFNCGVQSKKIFASFCASVIPLALSALLGISIKYYGNEAGSNFTQTGNFTVAKEVVFLVNNPLVHVGLLSLMVYAQYGLTKMLMDECCKKPCCPKDDINEEPGQNYLQILLKVGTDAIEPIAMFEALRMIFFMAGQEPALSHKYFPLLVVACDQSLKCWRYMSRIPKPMDNLVPADSRYRIHIVELENTIGEEAEPSAPSNQSILLYASYYSMRALFAVSAGGLVAVEIANYIHAKSDQEKLSTRDRLINLMGICYATGIAEQAFDLTSAAISRISNCCSTLFSRWNRDRKRDAVDELDDPTSLIAVTL